MRTSLTPLIQLVMTKHFRIIIPIALCAILAIAIGYSIFRVHASEVSSISLANDANLVAYYRLEDTTGKDNKNSYDLTLHGSPSIVAAQFGNGLDTGNPNISTYAEVNSNLGITKNGPVSISAWVKMKQEITSSTWGIAGVGISSGNIEYEIKYVYNAGTRQVVFNRNKMWVGNDDSTYNIDLGTSWHHLVLVYNGTYIYGYVDGAPSTTISSTADGDHGATNHFTMGASNQGGLGEYGSYVIDDVSVFSKALTEAEVASLYAAENIKLAALKTADSSITSNTTPQTDTQLTLSLGHKTYTIDGIIFAKSSNSAPGIKFDFTSTSASFIAIGYSAVGDTIHTGGMLTATASTAVVPATANGTIPIRLSGTVSMYTAGDLALQWTQNLSSSDAMTVMKGSYLRATEIQ